MASVANSQADISIIYAHVHPITTYYMQTMFDEVFTPVTTQLSNSQQSHNYVRYVMNVVHKA